jgi:hypothetical protein
MDGDGLWLRLDVLNRSGSRHNRGAAGRGRSRADRSQPPSAAALNDDRTLEQGVIEVGAPAVSR